MFPPDGSIGQTPSVRAKGKRQNNRTANGIEKPFGCRLKTRSILWSAKPSHVGSDSLVPVVAVFDDGAAFAEGVARAAEGAAVAYEVHVEGVELAGGHDAVHQGVRELVGAFRRYEADAAEHSEDVRVERKYLRAAGEEERAGDGLRADAAELREVARGIFRRGVAQEGEVERAVALLYLFEEGFDDGGLLVGEPARADSVRDG
jgi:hypothetical protein